jgi:hypothetical protein
LAVSLVGSAPLFDQIDPVIQMAGNCPIPMDPELFINGRMQNDKLSIFRSERFINY